jgi:hypothetical protein
MSYSAAVRREAYLSWRPIFSKGNNYQLRKRSKIQAVVNNYAPANYLFWHPNIITILEGLLQEGVFLEGSFSAKYAFPDLFGDSEPERSKAAASQAAACPTQSALDTEKLEAAEGLLDSIRW